MKKILFAALVCAMTSLASCDKLKHDFNVNNVKFAFEAPVTGNTATTYAAVTTRAAGMDNTFTVTRQVDISEMGSSEIVEYANKVNSVVVNNTLLKITVVPSGNYSVADVTLTADGVAGSLVVPAYTLGGAFTPPANMNAYTSALIMKLVSAKKVNVTITGQTDAPTGTTINISYESDLLIKASVL